MRKGLDIVQVVLAYILLAIGFLSSVISAVTQGSTWDRKTNSLKYPARGTAVRAGGGSRLPKLKTDKR